MTLRKNAIDKEAARQLRSELFDAINRGELGIREAVKRMRTISRLTQAEFAAHRGVSAKVIKELERGVGNPTVDTLNRIGQFFGLEVAFVRSERLHNAGQADWFTPIPDATATIAPVALHPPSDDLRRLAQELENIKKMMAPLKPLQDTLIKMETELHALRAANKLIAPEPGQVLPAALPEPVLTAGSAIPEDR